MNGGALSPVSVLLARKSQALHEMDSADHLRMCKLLTVENAAMLLACKSPTEMRAGLEKLSPELRPLKYEAAKGAIIDALLFGELEGNVRAPGPEGIIGSRDYNRRYFIEEPGNVDPVNSTVVVASLKAWAKGRGDTENLLFGKRSDVPGYLDPTHPHFSHRLAAAVKVWLEYENKDIRNRPVKDVLQDWLQPRARELGLVFRGEVSNSAIEAVATMAHWNTSGGPPLMSDGQDEQN